MYLSRLNYRKEIKCLIVKNTPVGILPSDNEDEAKGLEKEAYGEISRRGRPGLWRSSKVRFGGLSDTFEL